MKIRHDYRAEVGLPTAEKSIPWPWAAAVIAALALGAGGIAAYSSHARARQLSHAHAATLMASQPMIPKAPARHTSAAGHHQAAS